MTKGALGGFDINGANTGVLLDALEHSGGHPLYNNAVLEQLGSIDNGVTPGEAAQQLQSISNTLNSAIKAGTFGPWG